MPSLVEDRCLLHSGYFYSIPRCLADTSTRCYRMTAYCPSPLLMNRPANINTSLHYPILSLPSNVVQPSSPSLSRNKKPKKQSFSASSSASSSTCTPAAPSRLAAFLASLLPLPATASSADHERVKHRLCSDLLFPASSAAVLERCLSSADLNPIVSLTFIRCVMDTECVEALMRGLASHTALQSLAFEQCGDAVDTMAVVRQLHTLPALTSLSFWATSLASLHKHDMHTILSLPALTSLNVASTALPLHSQQSVISSLSSPTSRLTHLDLSNTGCDLSIAHLLASSLPSNSRLASLILHSNRLGRDGVLAICSSLSTNPALCHLDLRWNRLFTPSKPETDTSLSSVPSASLDTLVSSLQSNTSLTTLLLCGHAAPAASNLQSAVNIFTQRNRALKQPQLPNIDTSAAEAPARLKAATNVQGKKDSLSTHVNPLQLSPPLDSRSYSHSLSSAASPFSLSLEPVPSPSASEPSSSHIPVSPSPATTPAASSVDARLSSVVLQQEQEIGRQSKVISRLRAMVKKQEDAIKATKAQLRNNNQRLTPSVDASPPLPPRPTTPRTPASTAAEPWTPLSAHSGSAASDNGTVSVSPPMSASPRGSFTLEGSGGVGASEEEESGGVSAGQEFRVNLDLAATVVLLEQEKSAQERLMEEMRQSIKAQEAAAAAAQAPATSASSAAPVDGEQQKEPSSSDRALPPNGAVPAPNVLRTHDDERGRLVGEVADLRHQLSQLQLQLAQSSNAARTTGLRRDSAHHAAALLAEAKAEGERAVRERDDKIQALLSAQRVLAESREVQLAAMRREWRDKEKEWKEERDRMKEEVRRLRRRNNRLSNEPMRDRPQVALNTSSAAPQQPIDAAVSAADALQSSSSESSCASSDSSDGEDSSHMLASSQPLPARSSSSSVSSVPPAVPPKPIHSLGSVIAARIAALEAHKAAEESGRTKQARSVEEPKRDRKKSRRQRKREADQAAEEAAENDRQSIEQQAANEQQAQSYEVDKEAQEEKEFAPSAIQ